MNPDTVDFQYVLPDVRQQLLRLILRSRIFCSCPYIAIRLRQRLLVDFSIRCQRNLLNFNEVGGNHIFRQLTHNVLPHFLNTPLSMGYQISA
ncbi:hypothetical protein D3C71_1383630 [compost metagenome]